MKSRSARLREAAVAKASVMIRKTTLSWLARSAPKDQKAPLEQRGRKGHKVKPVPLDPPEQTAQLDRPDPQDLKAPLEQPDLTERRDLKVKPVPLGSPERTAQLDRPDLKAPLEQ